MGISFSDGFRGRQIRLLIGWPKPPSTAVFLSPGWQILLKLFSLFLAWKHVQSSITAGAISKRDSIPFAMQYASFELFFAITEAEVDWVWRLAHHGRIRSTQHFDDDDDET